MTKIITSQDYIDAEIVASKLAARDFAVFVSPAFEIEGERMCVLLDGHHSLAAALDAGVAPEITEYTAMDHDAVALIERGEIETFLEVVHMGADYRDAITGQDVW
jgi:acetyl esterase/lipase